VTAALLVVAVTAIHSDSDEEAELNDGLDAPTNKPLMSNVFRPIYTKKGDPRSGKGSFEVRGLPTSTSSTPLSPAISGVSGVVGRRKFGAINVDNRCTQQGGQCQQTSTCGSVVTRLLCPGPASITCCTRNSKACANIGGTCRDASTCVGTSSIGMCPGPKNIQCCTPINGAGGVALPSTPTTNDNCLYNFNGAQLAAKALSISAEYKKIGVKWNDVRRQFGETAIRYANSVSFVTSAMDALGWGCIFATDKQISAMIANMKIRSSFRPNQPKVGDIAVALDDVAIVTAVCDGGAALALMGASGPMVTGCISVQQIQNMARRPNSFQGFWTPV